MPGTKCNTQLSTRSIFVHIPTGGWKSAIGTQQYYVHGYTTRTHKQTEHLKSGVYKMVSLCWWPFFNVPCKHMYYTDPMHARYVFCVSVKNYTKIVRFEGETCDQQFSFATAMKHTKRQYFRRKLFLCWFLKSALYWLVVLCTNTHLDNLVIHRSFCNDRDTKSLKYTILWKLQCAMLKEEKEWKI